MPTAEVLQQLTARDLHLKRIVAQTELSPIQSTQDVFYDLVSCIVDQQIHYSPKQRQFNKVKALLEGQAITPATILQLDEYAFSLQKISNLKYQTLIRLAAHWQTENWAQVDWVTWSDEQVRTQLSSLPKGFAH